MQQTPRPYRDSPPSPNKGSVLLGIALFFALLAANAILGTLIYTVANAFGMGYSRDALYLSALPALLFIAALIFLLAKRKTRTAVGLAIPTLITAGVLGFGLVATLSKLAALGVR